MLEIERKFLLAHSLEDVANLISYKETIQQSYFSDTGGWNIRVRKRYSNFEAATFWMTMKRHLSGFTAREIEFPIPEDIYEECIAGHPVMTKTRHHLVTETGKPQWVIDQFHDPVLNNLIMAEIELPSEDYPLVLPDWVGEEVTSEKQYRNWVMYETISRSPV